MKYCESFRTLEGRERAPKRAKDAGISPLKSPQSRLQMPPSLHSLHLPFVLATSGYEGVSGSMKGSCLRSSDCSARLSPSKQVNLAEQVESSQPRQLHMTGLINWSDDWAVLLTCQMLILIAMISPLRYPYLLCH